MKQKLLLFTAVAGISALTLSSYDNGPYAGGSLNRTGAAGSSANCSGAGCHSSNNTNTAITIAFTDSLSNPVTTYVPGKKYTVHIGGTNTTANLPKFGLQLAAVKSTDNTTQAGTLATGGTAGLALRTASTPDVIEHSSPLSGTGSGNNWVYHTTCEWIAPAAGTGAVKFFLTLNAVNGNGGESGDQPNATSASLSESLSVGSIDNNAEVVIYPNPAIGNITVHVGNSTGAYTINTFDLRGKMIASQITDINTNNQDAHINSEKWASGLYMIQISKDGEQKVFPIVKQ